MILVDKNIKEYVSRNELITEGYDEANVNGVSYDLTIGSILDEKENEVDQYQLEPGEIVFIKSKEMLKIPLDILGRIAEKNSRMRQGLKIDGPHYQPGHETYAYLRVQNVSGTNTITLTKGMRVAQIIFEQLQEQPDVTYDLQKGASFQNEEKYRGLGNYQKEYSRQIRSKEKQALDELENVSQKIYANVLTIMGVLVAVFSLLTINYQAFTEAVIDFRYVLIMNLTLALSIVVLMGIILIFINRAKSKVFLAIYTIILVLLAATTILFGLYTL